MSAETWFCQTCGSHDIRHDAIAVWDPGLGDFKIVGVLDDTWCETCMDRDPQSQDTGDPVFAVPPVCVVELKDGATGELLHTWLNHDAADVYLFEPGVFIRDYFGPDVVWTEFGPALDYTLTSWTSLGDLALYAISFRLVEGFMQ